jgi:2-hydroxychromene-2-carboxylate isomerase
MPNDAIDFWFSTGSTYTYLTVSRLPDVAAATSVHFNWRPFSVRTIMREQNSIPFVGKPVKTAYMPTFVVRSELFWGDDRLDDAPSWHRHGRLSP